MSGAAGPAVTWAQAADYAARVTWPVVHSGGDRSVPTSVLRAWALNARFEAAHCLGPWGEEDLFVDEYVMTWRQLDQEAVSPPR